MPTDADTVEEALRLADQLELGASIISVCDAFDAMISDRQYRHAMPVGDAIDELRRCSGTQFRPDVVKTFCKLAFELELIGSSH